jgi:hypothetical protein
VYFLQYFIKTEDKEECIDTINFLKFIQELSIIENISSVEFEVLTAMLAACFMLVTYLAYTLTLKMEDVCSSETPMNLCQATQHHIPEESIRQNIKTSARENLGYYKSWSDEEC